MVQEKLQNKETTPSLLRQIVDEVDAMDREKQHLLLLQLRKNKLLADAKLLDQKLKGNTIHLTEEEITEIVSKDRRERYEQQIRH